MGNATTVAIDDDRIEIGIVRYILIKQVVIAHSVVNALKFLTQPFKGHIGTTNAGEAPFGIVDGLDKRGVVTADVSTIIIIVGV